MMELENSTLQLVASEHSDESLDAIARFDAFLDDRMQGDAFRDHF
jgi:hypothetical protein